MRYGSEAWDLAFNHPHHILISDIESRQENRLYNLKRIEKIINQLELDKIQYNQITRGTPYCNNINYDAEIRSSKEAYNFLLSSYNSFNLHF